jgi:putative FmdB family regulatory protein
MPIYEYVCSSCDIRFERLVRRFGDAVECPSCASSAVEKQLSTFAVASGSAPAAGPCGLGEGACGASCSPRGCGLLD